MKRPPQKPRKRQELERRIARLRALYEERLQDAARSREELEKRMFHLKTLYDVSREIGVLIDTEAILKNLLMMVVGTFGAERGLIVLRNSRENRIPAIPWTSAS